MSAFSMGVRSTESTLGVNWICCRGAQKYEPAVRRVERDSRTASAYSVELLRSETARHDRDRNTEAGRRLTCEIAD